MPAWFCFGLGACRRQPFGSPPDRRGWEPCEQPRAWDGVQAELLEQRDHIEDPVKSLYEKLGVASRHELITRVFLDEYLPEVKRQTPLTSRRRFDREYQPRSTGSAFRTGTT